MFPKEIMTDTTQFVSD